MWQPLLNAIFETGGHQQHILGMARDRDQIEKTNFTFLISALNSVAYSISVAPGIVSKLL